MHPRHAPGPGYPSGCRWPACGITCAAPAVRRVACDRACERRTPHSDTARSWRRKSVGYARHGLPRGQAEAGIRSGPALATGRAIGGRTAWYRWVGGLHPLNLMQLGASLRSNQAGPRDDERPPDMGHPRRCCVGRRCRGALWALRRGGRLRWPRRHRHLTVRRGGGAAAGAAGAFSPINSP